MTIINGLYRGSNTDKNKFYHANWYGKDECQRLDSMHRMKYMGSQYDFRDKIVLDLGCNIGFFSFGIGSIAKKVTGIDYDKNAIEFANKTKKENNVENIEFINSKITLEKLKEVGPVDCTLGLAVHSWIMHEDGIEEVEKIFDWCSKNSKVNFIELQYEGEPGAFPGLKNDNDCKKYLEKYFKIVYKVCQINGWGPRTIWKCLNDEGKYFPCYRNNKTECYLSENCIFKKIRIDKNHNFNNEIKYLKILNDESHIPIYIRNNEDELVMSGINGLNMKTMINHKICLFSADILERELFYIYNILEKHKIQHQDISLDNIIISLTGELFLIDFEYSSDDGTIKNIFIKDEEQIKNLIMIKNTIEEYKRVEEFYSK